jgi:hypothetical protein
MKKKARAAARQGLPHAGPLPNDDFGGLMEDCVQDIMASLNVEASLEVFEARVNAILAVADLAPEKGRALAAGGWDDEAVEAVVGALGREHPGLAWAVVDSLDRSVEVFADLLDAVAAREGTQCVLPCKVGEGGLHLFHRGGWRPVPSIAA